MYCFIFECAVFGGKDFVMVGVEIGGDFVIRYELVSNLDSRLKSVSKLGSDWNFKGLGMWGMGIRYGDILIDACIVMATEEAKKLAVSNFDKYPSKSQK